MVTSLDEEGIEWQLDADGDALRAHAALDKLRVPAPNPNGRVLRGRVVDAHGVPVAGATVAADDKLEGDSVAVASGRSASLRIVTTGGDGEFEISDAVPRGLVIAQLGDRRSRAMPIADGVVLALAQTSRIDGRLEMHGVPSVRFSVRVKPFDAEEANDGVAGVLWPDGTFKITGAPRGRVSVEAMVQDGTRMRVGTRIISISQPVVHVDLDFPGTPRKLDVITRSTMNIPHSRAYAIVLSGSYRSIDGKMFRQMNGEAVGAVAFEADPARTSPEVAKRLDATSTVASFDVVPEGPISACVVALPSLLNDFQSEHLFDVVDSTTLHCTPIEPNDTAVVVDVDPLRRLD